MSSERQAVICCCGADVWLKVFAALNYIYSVVVLGLSIQFLNGLDALTHFQEAIHTLTRIRDGGDSYQANSHLQDLYNFVLATSVIELILNLAMASVLLFGTMKKNVSGLWTGLILQALTMVFGVIVVVVILTKFRGDMTVDVVMNVVLVLVGVFVLYVIHCRIREVKEETENPGEQTAVYTS